MFTKWLTGNSFKTAAVVVIGASLLTSAGCSLLPNEDKEEVLPEIAPPQISKKPEYEVSTATLETKKTQIGKMIATQEETLYFSLDGKRLKELNVKINQKVTAGQVIGTLDVDDMKKQLRSDKLQFSKDELQMKDTLRKKDEMDPIEFELAKIDFEEKRQKLVDAQEEIDKAVLTSPFTGTIVSLNVAKGDSIKAYDPVCIIADTSKMTAAAKMTQDELEGISVGMPVTVDINNAGEFSGKVVQLPVVSNDDENGGNGGGGGSGGPQRPERPEDFLTVSLDKPLPKGVTRGTPLSISIIMNRKENAIVIPPSALRTIGSRTYVQVIDSEGKREVDVEVGQQTATEVEILKGLTPGQKVVGK
ncbi:efflux RND transporter periplasmic adaptor subunit [Paenibacillus sacheonensis]|uniref:Biotin/lipoyl-binding protein n=1 Tax=Paenibacillus sacheonensis TaxID=742054 RepID=A0A7X4YTF5_9BACL|nr:biotin/lipoyl-binding protein [Paenibacillus sacheonensis]MBM7565749.1 macrolide-specific efflux system membrane fusion protein [Paenibacillus sacheonensis]NBC72193.1 biotin/lipoyl-binding protein [Paenibacillus sacheonensis]